MGYDGVNAVRSPRTGVYYQEDPYCLKANKMTKRKRKFSQKKYKTIINENRSLIDKRKNSELSDGEKRVANCLTLFGIEFIREYYMKGLYSPTSGLPLFFDFYIPKLKMAIEYDGRHHFKPVYGEKQYIDQKKKDAFKNYFCNKNKIILIRIPFFKDKETKAIILKAIEKHYKPL